MRGAWRYCSFLGEENHLKFHHDTCDSQNKIIEDEWGLDLKEFYGNVDSRVKPGGNLNKVQAFL
jgi:hypothetical protein